MTRSRAIWLAILCLNVAWMILLESISAKSIAMAGTLIAGLAIGAPFASATARSYLTNHFTITSAASVIGAFLVPTLSFIGTPRLVFWTIDGRTWLILAWLYSSIVLTRQRTRDTTPSQWSIPFAIALFIVFSSALWLTLVGDLGVRRFVIEVDRTVYRKCQSDPLVIAFTIWETHPASEHLFLGWRTFESFDAHRPYANHVQPYLLTIYAWVRGVRGLTGVPTHVATNTVPFFYMLVLLAGVTTLLARGGILRDRRRTLDLVLIFVACGLIVTSWRFWNDLYRYSSDNPYPLLAAVLVLVFAFLIDPVRPALAAVSAAAFVVLSPIHAPMLVIALWCLFGTQGNGIRETIARNRTLLTISLASIAIGLLTYAVPWLLIAWKHYTPEGSSILFRSGLDGDTRYFSNVLQAVAAPCPVLCCWGRPLTALLFPAFVPLIVFGSWIWRAKPCSQIPTGRLLLFLAAPYLISLLLFPQSISIHPYMYDHLLLAAVTVTGIVAMLNVTASAQLTGSGAFILLLVLAGVLMSNLLGIAQGLAAMPR